MYNLKHVVAPAVVQEYLSVLADDLAMFALAQIRDAVRRVFVDPGAPGRIKTFFAQMLPAQRFQTALPPALSMKNARRTSHEDTVYTNRE